MPVQVYFARDRVKALVPKHPEWKTMEPFASLLAGDLRSTLAAGDEALLKIVMATHAGMSTVEFGRIVEDWIATAKHPQTGRLFTEMVYQPMLELLAYLRANGFQGTSSSRAAASSSCANGASAFIASPRSRSSAAAVEPGSRCATANRYSCACQS